MPSYLLAIDQGTTGSTVLIVDESLAVRAKVTHEFRQIYPKPGWVEHDPEDLWGSVLRAVGDALAQARITATDLAAIGITNQRETTLLWDRARSRDGAFAKVHDAIVWQDRRTASDCAEIARRGLEPLFRKKTGLVLDPYFSGTKAAWLLRELPGLRRRAVAGELAFGTVDTYLIWRLSGGRAHVTDCSNASRTLLFELERLDWDAELCDALGVPLAILPEVRGSAERVAVTKGVPGLPDGIPIAGIAGDQQAALFGQACFAPGDAKCTYGTGAFLLMNTGQQPVPSTRGLLTTVGWRLGPAGTPTIYALEGSAFIAGAMVQWLRDGLGLIKTAAEIEALARQVEDSAGVVVVPALAGLGAPHWRPDARGLICGLTRGVTRAHIARATLEGIALQIADLLHAMQADAATPLGCLRVDGGATQNDLLLQIQADLLGVPISRPEVIETTGFGAASLAGLGIGLFSSTDGIKRVWQENRAFIRAATPQVIERMVAGWRQAVAKA